MLVLNVWNLKPFVAWIGFWIIFYKIDMHPKLYFTLLKCMFCVAPYALSAPHTLLKPHLDH